MRIALLIEYDGHDFSGWQFQENGRSVQQEIERGFEQLFGEPVALHGAGRTDAGVHARGMVAHADMPEDLTMTLRKLLIAINATTPRDIAIRDLRTVPDDFHARHSARLRTYRYSIKAERTALERNVVWAIRRTVDSIAMEQATAMLVGEHDFTSFSKRTNDVNHYRCIVERAEWHFERNEALALGTSFALTISANRFVRGMVRALVGALVQVGQAALSVEEFGRLLQHPREYARAKYIAPAHGLVLEAVEYPEHFGLWPLGWQARNNE